LQATSIRYSGLALSDALKKAGCSTIHQEVVSGAKTERPALNTVIKGLRKGDVLWVGY